ncbi:MAG: hypothetical protein GXP50_00945 [Deltaproteobacteria bacterium]|nr:hypothetical protein [Deltaproteobacteria bacterium]
MKSIFQTIEQINRAGGTVLLVEQNARAAPRLATGGACSRWAIVLEGPVDELPEDPEVQQAYLGGRR